MGVSLQEKLTATLERLAQAQRVLLWEKTEPMGLSPTQALILLHLGRCETEVRRVGALARAFDLTPATVSDAVRALESKGLLRRTPGSDRRVQVLELTARGELLVQQVQDWDRPLRAALLALSDEQQATLYGLLLPLLARLVDNQVITIARMCLLCQHFRPDASPAQPRPHYCALLEKPLGLAELRLDCPEFTSTAHRTGPGLSAR